MASYRRRSASGMTSYGGATSALRLPALASRYRIPGSARTSAIGRAPKLDVSKVGHAGHVAQARKHVGADRIVDGEDHHRVAPRRIATHLHARDVDVVLAQDRAKAADHPRPVIVPADQESPLWHQVDSEGVDSNRTRLPHEHRARELVALHTKRDETGVASVRRAAALDQLDAPARRDEARVDGVDAVFRERLQNPANRRRNQQVHVVLSHLTLELELDRAHPAAEELAVQRCQALGEQGEWAQVNELFGRERGGVDRIAGQIAGEHRGDFLGHVERDRCLSLDRGRGDVRSGDEVGQPEEGAVTSGLVLEHVCRRCRQAPGLERGVQSRFIDDAAARGIDQSCGGFDQSQLGRADEMPVGIHQWHVDGDEVGPSEKVVQRDQLHVEELGALDRDNGVVSQYLHLESVRALGDFRADVAQADDAEYLASDLGAYEERSSPLTTFHRFIRLRHRAGECEQERNRVFGGRDDVSSRRVDDKDAFARRGGHVDVVDPDPRAPHDPQSPTRFENWRGHLGFAPYDQGVEVWDSLDQLSLGQLVDHGDLASAAQPLQAVLGERVRDEDPGQLARYAGTLCSEAVAAATARPSAGATSSSSRACSIAHSTWTTSPSATAPRWPTRTSLPVIFPCPPAMTTPYFLSRIIRSAPTSTPGGVTAEVTVFERYPSCAKSWKPSACSPDWVARASLAWRS